MEPVFQFALILPARGHGARAKALHQQLRTAILDGRLAAGTPLPATRRAAAALDLARNTIVAAYDLLVAEGYALPRRGARTVVADIAIRRPHKARRSQPSREDPRINPIWRRQRSPRSLTSALPARSFRLGVPEHRHFPHEIWRRLCAQSLRGSQKAGFGYAPAEGIPALREAIAGHVAYTRAVACKSDDVIVTAGAQQAFDLLARLLVTPTQTRVVIEEPGYPPLRAAFTAAGAELLPVRVDDEGLCVDRLPPDVHVIVVTPSHQFPTGVALSLRRRTALLDFARAHRSVIIEDDYDGEFRFGGRPLDALQTLDRDALVFYVGTFSKSMFPSLRKGFIVAPPWARDALATVKEYADSHCDTLTQAVLAAFIHEGHLARYVRRMHADYAARREALLEALQGRLCAWLEPIPSEAGLHLAAHIRAPARAQSIIAKARLHTAGAQSIAEYALTVPERPALAFGYGVIDASEIRASLMSLRRALDAMS